MIEPRGGHAEASRLCFLVHIAADAGHSYCVLGRMPTDAVDLVTLSRPLTDDE